MHLRAFYMLLFHVLPDWFSMLFPSDFIGQGNNFDDSFVSSHNETIHVCNRSVLPLLHRVLNNRQDMKCMQK